MLPLSEELVRPYSWIGPGRCVSGWARSPEELYRGFRYLPPSDNGFIQLNASRLGYKWRPRASHVPAIQAVIVDLDREEGQPHTSIEDAQYVQAWLLAISGLAVGQLAWVDSGRGYQFWILVDNAPPSYARRIPTFLRVLKDSLTLETSHVDTSVCDLPRLARAPGTFNPRAGRDAILLRSGRPGSYAWLDLFEPLPEPAEHSVPTIASGRWEAYFPHLTGAAQRFILGGAVAGNRHQQAFATAASLRDAGASEAVALAAVSHGAWRCQPRLEQGDAAHAVTTAYRKE